MKRLHMTLFMAMLALVVGCSPAVERAAENVEPAEQPESPAQASALGDVDTSVQPSGPTVGELITSDEACAIVGRDDLFLAVPAG